MSQHTNGSRTATLIHQLAEALINCNAWLVEYEKQLQSTYADAEQLDWIRATIAMADAAIDSALLSLSSAE